MNIKKDVLVTGGPVLNPCPICFTETHNRQMYGLSRYGELKCFVSVCDKCLPKDYEQNRSKSIDDVIDSHFNLEVK